MFLVELITSFLDLISKQATRECRRKRVLVLPVRSSKSTSGKRNVTQISLTRTSNHNDLAAFEKDE